MKLSWLILIQKATYEPMTEQEFRQNCQICGMFFMPQFEFKVSDLIGPRVAVILVIKINFFKVILHRLKKIIEV